MGRSTNTREARSFGLVVGSVFGLIAAAQWWHGREALAAGLSGLAAYLVGAALVQPAWLRVPNALWWRLARVLGWVNSRILLSALFFAVFTPVGVILRLTGWDAMRRARRPGQSLWEPYPARLQDAKHYERMY